MGSIVHNPRTFGLIPTDVLYRIRRVSDGLYMTMAGNFSTVGHIHSSKYSACKTMMCFTIGKNPLPIDDLVIDEFSNTNTITSEECTRTYKEIQKEHADKMKKKREISSLVRLSR